MTPRFSTKYLNSETDSEQKHTVRFFKIQTQKIQIDFLEWIHEVEVV